MVKINLLNILLLLSFASCDNDKEEQAVLIPLINYEISVDIRVEDSTGMDLLNRGNIGHYKDSDIEILGSDDSPNAISIQKYSPETDYYYLKLALNYPNADIEKAKHYKVELISKLKFGNNLNTGRTAVFAFGLLVCWEFFQNLNSYNYWSRLSRPIIILVIN